MARQPHDHDRDGLHQRARLARQSDGAGPVVRVRDRAGDGHCVRRDVADEQRRVVFDGRTGLAGSLVVVGANSSGVGSVVYGVIVSNTSTVLTVDQWYSGTSATGAAGTTPNATGQYIILPGQNPAAWMAVTSDATTPTTADTTLTSELTTSGMGRAVGTYAHTAAATTYTLTHLWTASGTVTINKEAQFGAATVTGGGVMPFESAEPSPPTLVSGDTLQNSITITI